MSLPTGLSASAVTTAVRRPKQRRKPRATLYSPPPSQTLNERAVEIRPSPGSSRSITSPSATRSKLHSSRRPLHERSSAVARQLGQPRRTALTMASASACQAADLVEVSAGEEVRCDHPAAAAGRHLRQLQVVARGSQRSRRRSARSSPRRMVRRAPSDRRRRRRPRPGRT